MERSQLSHWLQAFSVRRQAPFPGGFGNSTNMRDKGMCQHRGVKNPAGCDSLGKLVLPGWCNRLSLKTTFFLPTRSHHEAPLGQLLMSVSWKGAGGEINVMIGGFRKQVACVCVGMWTLHHGAVEKDTFKRTHWNRQDGQTSEKWILSQSQAHWDA